jgi:hypothetical protein
VHLHDRRLSDGPDGILLCLYLSVSDGHESFRAASLSGRSTVWFVSVAVRFATAVRADQHTTFRLLLRSYIYRLLSAERKLHARSVPVGVAELHEWHIVPAVLVPTRTRPVLLYDDRWRLSTVHTTATARLCAVQSDVSADCRIAIHWTGGDADWFKFVRSESGDDINGFDHDAQRRSSVCGHRRDDWLDVRLLPIRDDVREHVRVRRLLPVFVSGA